jgi:hypothetical protein
MTEHGPNDSGERAPILLSILRGVAATWSRLLLIISEALVHVDGLEAKTAPDSVLSSVALDRVHDKEGLHGCQCRSPTFQLEQSFHLT